MADEEPARPEAWHQANRLNIIITARIVPPAWLIRAGLGALPNTRACAENE